MNSSPGGQYPDIEKGSAFYGIPPPPNPNSNSQQERQDGIFQQSRSNQNEPKSQITPIQDDNSQTGGPGGQYSITQSVFPGMQPQQVNDQLQQMNIQPMMGRFSDNPAANLLMSNYQRPIPKDHLKEYQEFINQNKAGPTQQPQDLLQSVIRESPIDQYDLSQSDQPSACIAHVVFQVAAFFLHFIGGVFFSGFTIHQIIIILSAVDFWTVQNVTGRLLVGLRYWSESRIDGDEIWVFQCKVDQSQINPFNNRVFWGVQALGTVAWLLLFVLNVLAIDISDVIETGYGVISCGWNLYAFYKCSKAQSENVQKLATKLGADFALNLMSNSTIQIPLS